MQHKKILFFMVIMVSFALVSAKLPKKTSTKIFPPISKNETIPTLSVEEKIKHLYDEFSIHNSKMPSFVAFQNGMLGYYKLLNEGEVQNKILTIVDFSLSSVEKRMWVLDMLSKKVLFHTFVAHGQGTGVEMATKFSNVQNSHQSSLGFYLTAETYIGKHGLSMRMDGLEKGFNSNARDRYIVVHGADYATPKFIENSGRLGRSWGCPAVPPKFCKAIINTIKNKSCFFVYFPSEKYLKNSKYLNFERT